MAYKRKTKGEDWRRKLPRPIVLIKGKPLVILGDCRDYCLNELDEYEAKREAWQKTITLMFEAAKGGDLEIVVTQFEALLLHAGKLRLS